MFNLNAIDAIERLQEQNRALHEAKAEEKKRAENEKQASEKKKSR